MKVECTGPQSLFVTGPGANATNLPVRSCSMTAATTEMSTNAIPNLRRVLISITNLLRSLTSRPSALRRPFIQELHYMLGPDTITARPGWVWLNDVKSYDSSQLFAVSVQNH